MEKEGKLDFGKCNEYIIFIEFQKLEVTKMQLKDMQNTHSAQFVSVMTSLF